MMTQNPGYADDFAFDAKIIRATIDDFKLKQDSGVGLRGNSQRFLNISYFFCISIVAHHFARSDLGLRG